MTRPVIFVRMAVKGRRTFPIFRTSRFETSYEFDRAALVRNRIELAPDGEMRWIANGQPVRGHFDSDGYRRVIIRCGPKVFNIAAHRIAWLLHHGDWPKQQIDHINRDRADNRIENLRDVSAAENAANRIGAGRRLGTSAGWITMDRRTNRWRAAIYVDGKPVSLGGFATAEEAEAVRLRTAQQLGRASIPIGAQGGDTLPQVPAQTSQADASR